MLTGTLNLLIRYFFYMKRYFNMHLKADISQLNLGHGTKKLKTSNKGKTKKQPTQFVSQSVIRCKWCKHQL